MNSRVFLGYDTLTLNFIICELSSYGIKAIVACILCPFKTSLSFIFEMTFSFIRDVYYKWRSDQIIIHFVF